MYSLFRESIKMTNKEDEDEQYDPDMIALLAMHLVSQVLDEACVIAKSAREAGQSWQCLKMLKYTRGNARTDTLGDISTVSKGDSNVNKDVTDVTANAIITSTPQKHSDEKKHKIEPAYIGQGDEELEIEQDELTNSTSMFIHDLFDMSEVGQVILCDNSEIMQKNSESKDLLNQAINAQAISTIIDSHVNAATRFTFEHDQEPANIQSKKSSITTECSDYSFLDDAYITNSCKGEGFRFEDDEMYDGGKYFKPTPNISGITELAQQNSKENMEELIQPENMALNEDVYLTLNRDYDQYSEDDGDPVLQDPKGLILQEVELLTANTSDDNISRTIKPRPVQKSHECLAGTIISEGGSRKSALIRRCRRRGARLFSCLRIWWPFKSAKRKERFDTIHGACPLCYDAGRRASSSLDQRLLRSTTPSNSITWKFNTVNEAIVSSTHWNYTFENKTVDFAQ